MTHFEKQDKFINELIKYWRDAPHYEKRFRWSLMYFKFGWYAKEI